ncbi:MAG: PaaI family thioesterase [Syntrophobacterales bacterium]
MPNSDKQNSFHQEQRELSPLQRDGINKKLSNNPVVEFVGIKLVKVVPGRSYLVLPHREELKNSMGLLQGGILGVLADVAGGVSLYSVLPDPVKVVIPTIEFKLNFLRPAGAEDVIARGRVAHHGRRIAVCQVDLSAESEILLATGLFTYMIREIEAA